MIGSSSVPNIPTPPAKPASIEPQTVAASAPRAGRMLGNFPQAFVHLAFVGAAIDLKAVLD